MNYQQIIKEEKINIEKVLNESDVNITKTAQEAAKKLYDIIRKPSINEETKIKYIADSLETYYHAGYSDGQDDAFASEDEE